MLACAVLASCAQVGSPSGGPKDETPPQLISAFPELGATQVDGQRMVLEFDEYVKASNWRSQLLVSPPLNGAVELEVRGREVWVSWDEALRAQTTYVFQFGDAVADVNEGNAANNLRHAFSTGTVLDTLSIRGRVLDALKGDAQSGMRVMLFPGSWSVDSVLAGATPAYVATTFEDGRFDVSFLPNASFHVVALRDENRNYAWEPGEDVAILERQASTTDTTSWLLWSGATPAPSNPYMSEAVRDEWGWASWRLSEPWAKSDSLEWLTPADKPLQPSGLPPSDGMVHARGWSSDMDSAGIQLVWHRAPVWGQRKGRLDTMSVPRPRLVDLDSLRLLAKPQGRLMPEEAPIFEFSAPLDSFNETQVTVWVDSVEVENDWGFTWSHVRLNTPQTQRPGVSVQVSFRPGALRREDAKDAWPRDTLDMVWSTLPQDALSTWRLKLEGVDCPGWIEVALGSDQVDLVRVEADTTLTWAGLKPRSLNATWWGDPNGNGMWEQVNVMRWQAPEPVLHLDPVALRANWEVETVWRLDSAACARNEVSR
jgi:hypothetical protein